MGRISLGDTFNEIFKTNFSISEDEVFETYNNPDFIQELKIGVKLFIKGINKEERRDKLLLCVQDKGDYSLFAFSYWLPEELVDSCTDPLNILREFVLMFGSIIKVGYSESLFIEETTVALEPGLMHLEQVIQVLGSEHIPCQYYFFYGNEFIVSDSLTLLDIHYAFSINNNKYISWLHKLSEAKIKVPKKWARYLHDVIELLEPNGATQLEILKPKRNNFAHKSSLGEASEKEEVVEVAIPEKYKHSFNHISEVIASLKPDEKIAIIPKFSAPKCLFCDSEDTSKEHIFPKWLKPFVDNVTFDSILYANTYEEDFMGCLRSGLVGKRGSSHGYTTRNVCKQCNNTWMSSLEDKVKSILVSEDKRLINELTCIDADRAEILSRWLLKISLLLIDRNLYYSFFPLNEYKKIKEGHIPDGIIVEVTCADSYTLNFIGNYKANRLISIRSTNMPEDKVRELSESFFMTVIQIGRLLFRVSYLPPDCLLLREICLKENRYFIPMGS
jgi:hypothetical protein